MIIVHCPNVSKILFGKIVKLYGFISLYSKGTRSQFYLLTYYNTDIKCFIKLFDLESTVFTNLLLYCTLYTIIILLL